MAYSRYKKKFRKGSRAGFVQFARGPYGRLYTRTKGLRGRPSRWHRC